MFYSYTCLFSVLCQPGHERQCFKSSASKPANAFLGATTLCQWLYKHAERCVVSGINSSLLVQWIKYINSYVTIGFNDRILK